MSDESKGRTGLWDLLIQTVLQHEKKLDQLIERLEKLPEVLSLTKVLKEIDKELDRIQPMVNKRDHFYTAYMEGLLTARRFIKEEKQKEGIVSD